MMWGKTGAAAAAPVRDDNSKKKYNFQPQTPSSSPSSGAGKRWGNQAGTREKKKYRSLPHNLEAEQTLIGTILSFSDSEDEGFHPLPIALECGLEPADFYYEENREIFQALVELFEKQAPLDPVSVLSHLRKKGKEEEKGGSYFGKLLELANSIPFANPETVTYYSRLIKETSRKKQALLAAQGLLFTLQDPAASPQEINHQAEEIFNALHGNSGKRQIVNFSITPSEVEKVTEGPDLLVADDPIFLPRGPYVSIIGGQGGVGKSFLLLFFVYYWAVRYNLKTIYVTLEDSKETISRRLKYLCRRSSVNLLRNPFNIRFLAVDPQPAPVLDRYSLSPTDFGKNLKLRLLAEAQQFKPDLIIVDPISRLIAAENDNAYMAEFSSFFDSIAKTTGTAVFLIHHLNKTGRTEDLVMNSIRGASSLTDCARLVFQIRNLEFYLVSSKEPERKDFVARIFDEAEVAQEDRTYPADWLLIQNTKNNIMERQKPVLIKLFHSNLLNQGQGQQIQVKRLNRTIQQIWEDVKQGQGENKNNGGSKRNGKGKTPPSI